MEPMQDKDFDQLFKHRFESFEVKPSDRLWENISGELDGRKKKKRAIPSIWMAAASVVILASAVLWLYKPVEVIRLQGKSDSQLAISDKPVVSEETETDSEEANRPNELPLSAQSVKRERTLVSRNADVRSVKASKRKETLPAGKVDPVQDGPMLATEMIEANELPKTDILIKESPVVLAQHDPVTDDPDIESEPSKQRIRSVGGLVNFVIAQVDKRDNKIIEFRDGDEGAAVSGINLGPLKFKSRNK